MVKPEPGFVYLSCKRCKGTSVIWGDEVSLLDSYISGRPMNRGHEVDCPDCGGKGWTGTTYVGEPALPKQVE